MSEAIDLSFKSDFDTFQDAVLKVNAHYAGARNPRKFALLSIAFLASTAVGIGLFSQVFAAEAGLHNPATMVIILATMFFLLLFAFVYRQVLQRTVITRAFASKVAQNEVRFHIDPEGIRGSIGEGQARYPWSLVDAVLPLKNGVCLLVGGAVYPIPAMALPAETSLCDFTGKLQHWHRAAQ